MALFAWLYYGVHADKLTLGQYEIEGLYIKLDKKLTLKVDKIILPKTKERPSFDNIDETFDRIKYLFTYFDYIDLQQIHFKNNKLKFLFADDVLYITTDAYEVAGNIERKGSRLIADVSLLYLKKHKVNIVGKLKYFLNKDRLEIEGAFEGFNIKGNFAAMKEDDLVSFAVKSDEFYDLKTLAAHLPLEDTVKIWITDRVLAKSYKLHSFVGKANIVDNALKPDLSSLRGEATLEDVKIKYKKELAPVLVKEAKLLYKENTLYFDLKDPSYRKRDLQGSTLSIGKIKKGKIPYLNLDLHIKSKLDAVVHEILQAYKVKVPVTQKGKEIRANIKLRIPLKKFKSAQEKAKHKVNVAVDASLSKGEVIINKKLKLPLLKGDLHYENGKITLKDVHLKERWYKGVLNGAVYLNSKKADLRMNVEELSIGEGKNKYFVLKNKALDAKLDYEKLQIQIPALKTKIQRKEKTFTITLSDLKTIKPYLKNLDIQIDGGHLDIETSDFLQYSYAGMLKRDACFFYDKENVCHTQIPCKGKISKKGLYLSAFKDRLTIDVTKATIHVNHLNVDLVALFKSRERKRTSTMKKTQNKTLRIFGKKSKLRYKEFTLVTDNYNIAIAPNGNINAAGKLGSDKVSLKKIGKNIQIEAKRIKDRLLHPLINFNGLHQGRYSFKASGDPDKVIYGEVGIEGGVMRDFKAYNNTLAFINTLPALATLHSPGYSKQGFHIEKGVAKYQKIGQKIIFDSIVIEGKSASFVGKGVIDLKKNSINMKLAIQTARELGKVVGSIPLLGYILMGDDKSMTVGLKITGSLSKPIVETSATKELLKLPLDLIKRTFQSPGHIVNKTEEEKQKEAREKASKKKKIEKQPKVFNKIAP